MSKPTLFLIFGLTGAGKTTYCDKLNQSKKGHVFSIDRWMKDLFWQDMPENPDMTWFQDNQDWYVSRISRCEDLITNEVKSLLALGTSCILDLGFTSVEHREKYINLGTACSVKIEIHFLDVDRDERWSRVLKRNHEKQGTYSMTVDEGMFNYMEEIFEPLTSSEEEFLKELV